MSEFIEWYFPKNIFHDFLEVGKCPLTSHLLRPRCISFIVAVFFGCTRGRILYRLRVFMSVSYIFKLFVWIVVDSGWLSVHSLPRPRYIGDGVLFSIDFFVSLFISFFLFSFFLSLLARLRENGWADLHEIFREGVKWPWDDLVAFFVNSEKPRDTAMRNTGAGFVVL